MPRFIDVTGKTINGWIALRYLGNEAWECVCPKCKRVCVQKSSAYLRYSNGCVACSRPRTRHGHSFTGKVTTEYHCWHGMMQRCFNPSNHGYKDYGGRGITVCVRWRLFDNFLKDMGLRPTGKTIDRINCNGNYEPTNCRWATRKEQQNNRRNTMFVMLNGEKMLAADAEKKLGYASGSLKVKIFRLNAPTGSVPTVNPLIKVGVGYNAKRAEVFI